MLGEKFPENREEPLVAQQHFPARLNELDAIGREARTKSLVPQPFPGIKLEAPLYQLPIEINKTIAFPIPANVLDINRSRFHARLLTSIAQIENRLLILR